MSGIAGGPGAGNPSAIAGSANTSAAPVSTVATGWSGACESFETASDYAWDRASEIAISLGDGAITGGSASVSIQGNSVTIGAAGTYRVSGSLSNGRLIVNSPTKGVVRVILDDAHITSLTDAALHVVNAEKVVIVLADGSTNSLADSANYSVTSDANAALFSQENLIITGLGTLTVKGNYKDGITSKDGLVIHSGNLMVTAIDDGIRGKDCLVLHDGTFLLNTGGDGLKADNDSDAMLGYVSVRKGSITAIAGGDGIAASTAVYVTAGTFTLTTGGGSGQRLTDAVSTKGIKGSAGVVIDGGAFMIDSADDAIHSGGVVYVNDGTLELASGDDGIHSDGTLDIDRATINITRSYEGLEGTIITFKGGTTHIVASDDGLNASDGSGASGLDPGAAPGQPGSLGVGTGGAMGMGPGSPVPPGAGNAGSGSLNRGKPGMPPGSSSVAGMGNLPPNALASATDAGSVPLGVSSTGHSLLLDIRGGTLVVNASGDGLDSNGNIVMSHGTVLVSGPTDDGNGAIDIGDGPGFTMTLSGGFLVAAGSSGMAVAPSDTSTQNAVMLTNGDLGSGAMGGGFKGGSTASLPAGTLVRIQNAAGQNLLTYSPAKQYASIVFSSPELIRGTYTVLTGGTCPGTVTDNLYTGCDYANGIERVTFTVGTGSVVTGKWSL